MKESTETIKKKSLRRARRVRAKVRGEGKRPRMSLHLSGRHISVQFIDDVSQISVGALGDKVLGVRKDHVTLAMASDFGKKAAAYALTKGIETVVFDRGSHAYHGRVQAFAEGAREGGLQF
ncbi:MAG: 50S ribosomal protein L18 [bacterium]|nr:50S ribosomal protein L18 [bacterium]